ncbi:MAG: bifunctional (p)ppGpp synthetase/guanosine-3',5'-bis(diphosphate) 3'-pyrophosphohydrolase [Chlorobiota bacterium]|nr:bifunctional (p)ppGpp synthetase/guanosine-3',5'-bis(diphosphate) 3'-pyrophosphohydrolase [Chlorobiota bacterium]QQS66061.1 MAG: bifunctional (p)ppGpp synthetase/guanosine-3',5'-bis(diphosphate) 3'-pyrophosphohydrolase [Chlorobiota bacterium]
MSKENHSILNRDNFSTESNPFLTEEYKNECLDRLLNSCKAHFKIFDSDLIKRAFYLCYDAHKKMIRASGEPYWTHPWNVAMIVAQEITIDDVSVAAALLHDVVEDTNFTIEDIKEEFGFEIAEIVDGVTKIGGVFHSYEVSQAASYRKLLLSMVNDVRVILVKFADRLHNIRTLSFLPINKQIRIAKETLEIYAPFANRFGLAKLKWELEDLSFKYINPDAYNQIKNGLKIKREERENYINSSLDLLKSRLDKEGFTYQIAGRPKHIYSIYNKMRIQGKDIDEIHDLFALRIILDTISPNDCFTVYGIISEVFTPVPEKFKNYISVPKKNGYQSIHTTVIGPNGKQVEIQIRTKKMHEIAERGVAAHFLYKESTDAVRNPLISIDKQMEDWVSWMRDVFDKAGSTNASQEVIESFKMNLFQDEIYVFTPKGELRILPKGSTPIDFAFEIHSAVGLHCIGAKVSGRIVPLNSELKSGDQIEILTSKNQTPSLDWEKFAFTHKAQNSIRKFFNESKRLKIKIGKDAWQKICKKEKFHINDDDLENICLALKYSNTNEMFFEIANEIITSEKALTLIKEKLKPYVILNQSEDQSSEIIHYDKFIKEARFSNGIIVNGDVKGLNYSYARCCNPIPGDLVMGVISSGKGVIVHRSNCNNIISLLQKPKIRNQIVDVNWDTNNSIEFLSGIRVSGLDRAGILNDVTHAILTCDNTNIRSVNIYSKDSIFEGYVTLIVKDLPHLLKLMERLRKIRNVKLVERFEQLT